MNRELWNGFIEQIDAQVAGDFIGLAACYESVTGEVFDVTSHSSHHLVFSMLEQAMNAEDKQLLRLTVTFVSKLSPSVQKDFQSYCHEHQYMGESDADVLMSSSGGIQQKLRNWLHGVRAA